MANLSEHFTEEEFTYSETAKAYGIPNKLDEAHKKVAIHTCQYLLEPLRKLLNEHYKTKVIVRISSGYRGPALNSKIGGAKNSQHMSAEATDFNAYKVVNKIQYRINPLEIYNLIKGWVKTGKLSVDQLIYEVSGSSIWIHVSHSAWGKTRDRKQFLMFHNGKYTLDK